MLSANKEKINSFLGADELSCLSEAIAKLIGQERGIDQFVHLTDLFAMG